MKPLVVEVWRGEHVESRHSVHVVTCELKAGATHIVRHDGDVHCVSFVRSAIKMFQALPLVEDGGVERFNLTSQELAVTIASHSGEPVHVAAVRSILHKAGVPERALACGAHPPMHQPSANTLVEAGIAPARIHNNCSGKHAGMLALSQLHAWRLDRYHELSHPMQQRVLQTIASWTGRAVLRHETRGRRLRLADVCAAARLRCNRLRSLRGGRLRPRFCRRTSICGDGEAS